MTGQGTEPAGPLAEWRDGVNVALNEAVWRDIRVDRACRRVVVAVEVLTLPPEGPAPDDTAVALVVDGVSRMAASLRRGRWNDAAAPVEPMALADLAAAVRGFGGCPIYGWEFVDPPETSWAHWRDRLSFDDHLSSDPTPHVLELFQESGAGEVRHLDLRIWFRDLQVVRRNGAEVPLAEFVDGGARWWDGVYRGDPRCAGTGIVPG